MLNRKAIQLKRERLRQGQSNLNMRGVIIASFGATQPPSNFAPDLKVAADSKMRNNFANALKNAQ